MSVDSEFHREFGACCCRKFESLSVQQHVRRIGVMSLIFVATLAYQYLIFVNFFDQYANNVAFSLLQSLFTFASIVILAITICRIVHSVKAIAEKRQPPTDEPLDNLNEGN